MTFDNETINNDNLYIEFEDEGEEINSEKLRSMPPMNVTATDWTTETILNQLKKGNININPSFQRRDAWSKERKSKFIESIFLGLPIPQIILAEQKGSRGKYIVIDGKQRLLSLRQFDANQDDEFEPLKLRGLEIKQELNGHTLADLENDILLNEELTEFQNHTIRTVVVRNWVDEEFLYLLFLRLNTESVKLSPQELRQALHPGPFLSFADEFTLNSKVLMDMLKIKKPDFRMRDVELVVRYYAFRNFLANYTGDLKAFLDETCEVLNKNWDKNEVILKKQASELEKAIEITEQIFGKYAFRKWNGVDAHVNCRRVSQRH